MRVRFRDVATVLPLEASARGRGLATHYGLRLHIEESSTVYEVLVDLNGLTASGCEVTVAGRAVQIHVKPTNAGTSASGISLVFADSIDTGRSTGDFSAGWLRLCLAKQGLIRWREH